MNPRLMTIIVPRVEEVVIVFPTDSGVVMAGDVSASVYSCCAGVGR